MCGDGDVSRTDRTSVNFYRCSPFWVNTSFSGQAEHSGSRLSPRSAVPMKETHERMNVYAAVWMAYTRRWACERESSEKWRRGLSGERSAMEVW